MKGLQSTLESDYGVAIGDSAKAGVARMARATLSGAEALLAGRGGPISE